MCIRWLRDDSLGLLMWTSRFQGKAIFSPNWFYYMFLFLIIWCDIVGFNFWEPVMGNWYFLMSIKDFRWTGEAVKINCGQGTFMWDPYTLLKAASGVWWWKLECNSTPDSKCQCVCVSLLPRIVGRATYSKYSISGKWSLMVSTHLQAPVIFHICHSHKLLLYSLTIVCAIWCVFMCTCVLVEALIHYHFVCV